MACKAGINVQLQFITLGVSHLRLLCCMITSTLACNRTNTPMWQMAVLVPIVGACYVHLLQCIGAYTLAMPVAVHAAISHCAVISSLTLTPSLHMHILSSPLHTPHTVASIPLPTLFSIHAGQVHRPSDWTEIRLCTRVCIPSQPLS